MTEETHGSVVAENERLKEEVAELRAGLQGIIDAFMRFDHFTGEEASAIARNLLEKSKTRLPE
jgi:hypothetical protein